MNISGIAHPAATKSNAFSENLFLIFASFTYLYKWFKRTRTFQVAPSKNRILIAGLLLSIAFVLIAPGILASPATIYVPDDYPTIQEAVDAASSGDTIIVRDGTYTENVNINKDSLTIKSENGAEATIVQAANPDDHVFEVTVNYVTISGFRVQGAGSVNAGIWLYESHHSNILNNDASGNYIGIKLHTSSANTVEGNDAKWNELDGINLDHSTGNTLTNNNVNSNARNGIYIGLFSSSNLLTGNNTVSNGDSGILLYKSDDNSIFNNTSKSNDRYGIRLLSYSNYNSLTTNTVSGNQKGITLSHSGQNTFDGNTISQNDRGIALYSSNANTFTDNAISGNIEGIYFLVEGGSQLNVFTNNTISNNSRGMTIFRGRSNEIYLNNFTNNTENVFSSSLAGNQTWHSPEQITYPYNGTTYTNYLGNYWSDYTGSDIDGDGIGDTPYSINSDNDDYPLMKSFENYIQEDSYFVLGTVFYSTTPLTGVTVELVQGDATNPPLQSVVTDVSGRYSFSDVAPGQYWVKAYGPTAEYIGWHATPIEVVSNDITQNIDLPKKIILLSPEHESSVTSVHPTLSWEANDQATKYGIQINVTDSWELVEIGRSSSNTYTVQQALTPGVNYTWQVDAWDANSHRVGTTEHAFRFRVTVEQPINFPDPNLEQAIREAINKPTGDIYPSDLEGLTEVWAPDSGISDLTGIEYCTSLQDLDLARNNISDLNPLANLTELSMLDLENNNVSNLGPLAGLTSLSFLDLDRNNISDLNPLANLTNLNELLLDGNNLSDLSVLTGLTKLQRLFLIGNNITNIQPLVDNSGLGSGDYIDIRNNYLDLSLNSDDMQNIQTLIDRGATVEYEPQNQLLYNPKLSIPVHAPIQQVAHVGTTLMFIFTVQNAGNETDTINLSIEDQRTWDITPSTISVTLSPGESRTIHFSITVKDSYMNRIDITGTSEGDVSQSSSVTVWASGRVNKGLFVVQLVFKNATTETHTLHFDAPAYVKINKDSVTFNPSKTAKINVIFDPGRDYTEIHSIEIGIKDSTSGKSSIVQIDFKIDEIIATNFDMAKDSYKFPNGTYNRDTCYGMSETSILYFNHRRGIDPQLPLPNNKPNTYSLEPGEAEDNIKRYQDRFINHLIAWILSFPVINEEKEYNQLEKNINEGEPVIVGLIDTKWQEQIFKLIKNHEWREALNLLRKGKVGKDRHAVVAYKVVRNGATRDIFIYDNEHPYDISKSSVSLAYPYATYNVNSQEFNYSDFNRFLVKEAETIMPKILLIASPLNATIVDQYGRILNDRGVNEIPGAAFTIFKETKLFYLPPDLSYSTSLEAYDEGKFTMSLVSSKADVTTVTSFKDVSVIDKTKATLEIIPDEPNQAMKVDYDGDDVIDREIDPATFKISNGKIEKLAKGDPNGDGVINIKDAKLTADFALELALPTSAQKEAADVVKPFGVIDARDVVTIAEVALGMRTGFESVHIARSPPAETSTVDLRIESKEIPTETTASFHIFSNPAITGLQVGPIGTLTFDPNIIQINEVKGVTPYEVLASKVDNQAGLAKFMVLNSGQYSTGNRELVEIQVETVGEEGDRSTLELTTDMVIDLNGNELKAEIINGSVTLGESEGPIVWEESGIFPSPVDSDIATLHIEGEFDEVTLMIFTLSYPAQKVVEETYTTNDAAVNLNGLDNGVYLYVLVTETGDEVKKSPVKKLLIQK